MRASPRGMRGEDFAAELAQILEPGAEVVGSCSSISRRRRWATAGLSPLVEMAICRLAAADDGAEEEIAVGNVVDAVAEDVALDCAAIDGGVDFGGVGGGDDEEVAVEVGGLRSARWTHSSLPSAASC